MANVLIIDNGSSFLSELQLLCGSSDAVQPGTINIEHAESYDAVILSGGHIREVVGGDDYYQREIELIKRQKVPIIGICLGFQLIAHVYGIPLHLMDQLEKGIIEIQPTHEGKKLLGINSFKVYEYHRWVVSKTPNGFRSLATSKDGVEAFQHADMQIAGFQFHPEVFTNKTQGRLIFELILSNFLKHKNLTN